MSPSCLLMLMLAGVVTQPMYECSAALVDQMWLCAYSHALLDRV